MRVIFEDEKDLETLEAQIRTVDKPAGIVPNVERMIVARIEKLEEAARDPSGERVRAEAQDLIGTVEVSEEGEHIIAEIDGAWLWNVRRGAGCTPWCPGGVTRFIP